MDRPPRLLLIAVAGFATVLVRGDDLLRDPSLKTFRLTTEKVEQVIQATKAMQSAAVKDAEFRKEYSSQEPVTATLDQTIAAMEAKRPRHCALIREAGLNTRDYFLTFLALFQADAYRRHLEGVTRDSVNPENVLFVQQNGRQFRTAIREIEKLNRIKEQNPAAVVP